MSSISPFRQKPSQKQTDVQLRIKFPLLWVLLALIAAFVLPSRVWNTLLIGLGGLFGLSYVWAQQMARHLHGRRQLRYGWVAVGDQLEEGFVLQNDSPLPALWVEVTDQANVPGYRPATVRDVLANGVTRWRETAVCERRGQYQLGPWQLRTSDPFGFFVVTHRYPVAGEIVIHPPIHTDIPIPLPAGQSTGRSRARDHSWQATNNAASVRAYRPNDPYRWIHWPTTARRNELFIREFDLDAAGDIWVLLDLQTAVRIGDGLDSTEEQSVLLAASLIADALHQNRGIGLATYGQQPQIIVPAQGTGQLWRLLRALALVQADGTISLSTALADMRRLARRGTAVVIITPSDQADWLPQALALQQSGIPVHVTLLDRASFGGTPSNAAIHTLVQQTGLVSHLVRQGELGTAPEQAEPSGFWDFIVTGTGKVVTIKQPGAAA